MNLLPDSRKRALAHLYLARVAVVSVVALSGVLAVHAILMLPSLIYLNQVVQDRTQELGTLGEQLAGGGDREVGERVARLTASATALAQNAQGVSASNAMRALTSVPHPGVSITGLSFARGQTSDAHRLSITGKATSREALRSYAAALGTLPYVKTVDLPISAYAKESNIDFSLTLIGTLTP